MKFLTTPDLLIVAALVIAIILIAVAIAVWADKQPEAAWKRWYARIDSFPSTKALILFAMGMFFLTGLVVEGNAIYYAISGKLPTPTAIDGLGTWLDKVLTLSGIGTVQYIGKRATEKAGMTNAPGEV